MLLAWNGCFKVCPDGVEDVRAFHEIRKCHQRSSRSNNNTKTHSLSNNIIFLVMRINACVAG